MLRVEKGFISSQESCQKKGNEFRVARTIETHARKEIVFLVRMPNKTYLNDFFPDRTAGKTLNAGMSRKFKGLLLSLAFSARFSIHKPQGWDAQRS